MNNIFIVEIYDDAGALLASSCINNEKLQELHLGGGLAKQQMLLLSANSGGGKSMVMANFGVNLAQQGDKTNV